MQRVPRHPYHVILAIVAPFLIGLAVLAAPGQALANGCPATVTVANADDAGAGSLRQAMVDVCPGGTIDFDPSLTAGGAATITLTSGELVITQPMTITGPGPDLLAVSGGGASRVFNVSSGINATLDGLTIRGGNGSGGNGGGILNAGTLTVTNSALVDNSLGGSNRGGALYNTTGGQVTINQSIVAGNSSTERGGGIFTTGSGLVTIVNTTFYSNTGSMGGALSASYGYVDVTNSTFSGNSATTFGAAIRSSLGAITITNTIVEQSLAGGNCSISPLADGGGNISDDNTCVFTDPTSRNSIDPMLVLPGDYGGDTQTMALLPGSPAIDSGVAEGCPNIDQRGISRPQASDCDSGAFESRGFVVTVTGGSPQTATIYSAFSEPLSATVSSNYNEPVGPGGIISFTPPSSGPGLTVVAPFNATTDANGLASSSVITANAIGGSYGVTATAGKEGVGPTIFTSGPAVFSLTNECKATDTVTSSSDSGPGTLRQAMRTLCSGGTIDFAPALNGGTITLTSGELVVDRDMTIMGPGAGLIAVSGNNTSRVFKVNSSVHARLEGLTLRNGSASGDDGGAIHNGGTLTVTNSAIADSAARNGAGIYAAGPLKVMDSVISGNSATSDGGGIEINDSTLIIVNSTFTGNSTAAGGGGLFSFLSATSVTNSTFAGNSAGYGGSIHADNGGVTFFNTIVAQAVSGDNCSSAGGALLVDAGGNLDDGSSCGFDTANSSFTNTDPLLAPLTLSEGTSVFPLLPGSPAVDSGVADDCPQQDQRGVYRYFGASCDSGAYESRGFSLAIAGGSPQSTTVYSDFADPLLVTVSSEYGEPVGPGGVITFTLPVEGPGLDGTTPFTASTNAGGLVSSDTVTANALGGSYNVTATVRGENVSIGACNAPCSGATSVVFELTNLRITPLVSIVTDPNPSFFGEPVQVTARVSTTVAAADTPTGQVVIREDGAILATLTLDANGEAATYFSEAVGSYDLAAEYLGNDSFDGAASGDWTHVVDKAPTVSALGIQPNPAFYGDKITFAVGVSSQVLGPTASAPAGPSGPVVITDTTGTIDLNGWAIDGQLSVSGGIIPAGTYEVVATYGGDDSYQDSSSQPVTLVVNKHPTVTGLESSANPVYVGGQLSFTAWANRALLDRVEVDGLPWPTGAIVIADTTGTVNLGGRLLEGVLTLDAPQLAAGDYELTATYLGDERYAPSESEILVQVVERQPTTTGLELDPNPALVGETVQLMARADRLAPSALASGGPSGVVEFATEGGAFGSAVLINGQALFSLPATAAGIYPIAARYLGDELYAPSSSDVVDLTVARRSTATTLGAAPNPAKAGQAVRFTAAVAETGSSSAWTPAGEVIFSKDGVEFGRANLAAGVATFSTALLPVGSFAITAEYAGSDIFGGSLSEPLEQVVQPMPLAVNDAAGAQTDPIEIDVTANDLDPAEGGLTIVSVTAPNYGSATIEPNGPNVIYRPAAGYAGIDSFSYVIQDRNGNRDEALVTVVVTLPTEGLGKPQVQPTDPTAGSSALFRTSSFTVSVQAPAGFYTGELAAKDILFVSFKPATTPSEQTNNPPPNLQFGNAEYILEVYLNNQLLADYLFAEPLEIAIDYDPALLGGLNAETLEVWYWDGAAWSKDGLTLVGNDPANHMITISTTRAGQFAFFAAAPTDVDPGEEPLNSFRIYLPSINQ